MFALGHLIPLVHGSVDRSRYHESHRELSESRSLRTVKSSAHEELPPPFQSSQESLYLHVVKAAEHLIPKEEKIGRRSKNIMSSSRKTDASYKFLPLSSSSSSGVNKKMPITTGSLNIKKSESSSSSSSVEINDFHALSDLWALGFADKLRKVVQKKEEKEADADEINALPTPLLQDKKLIKERLFKRNDDISSEKTTNEIGEGKKTESEKRDMGIISLPFRKYGDQNIHLEQVRISKPPPSFAFDPKKEHTSFDKTSSLTSLFPERKFLDVTAMRLKHNYSNNGNASPTIFDTPWMTAFLAQKRAEQERLATYDSYGRAEAWLAAMKMRNEGIINVKREPSSSHLFSAITSTLAMPAVRIIASTAHFPPLPFFLNPIISNLSHFARFFVTSSQGKEQEESSFFRGTKNDVVVSMGAQQRGHDGGYDGQPPMLVRLGKEMKRKNEWDNIKVTVVTE